ncbi:MAG TPA: magnesium transporter [Balneolales bacterium]|nr:magnesium transporter [Balneolales bacterium]
MIVNLLKPELHELIKSGDWSGLRDVLEDVPAADLAEIIEELDEDKALIIFRLVPESKSAQVFTYLGKTIGIELIKRLSGEHIKQLLSEMSPDDRVSLVDNLPGNLIQRVLNSMEPDDLLEVKKLLGYPENSVGRIMTTKYVRIKPEWTIEKSMQHIRDWGKSAETINVIYVVDENSKLIDDLKLQQLILTPLELQVKSIIDYSFVALNVSDDQEEAVKKLAKYDRVALPVIDGNGVLVGLVTADDIFDVAEEETTEDMQLMAGMKALDSDYSESSIGDMIKKRIGWLLVLFIGQILTATALGVFQDILKSVVILSLFIPMILSSGGNSGSQAATLIIRALSTDDINLKEWTNVFKREVLSGLILGLLVGISGFIIITVWAYFGGITFNHVWWFSATAVALSLISVVLFGNLLGSMMPFFLSKLGLDPAVTSGPFVSTISDVTGIVIYFSIAVTILKGVLF